MTSRAITSILESMGFKKDNDDNYYYKDYGNNIVLKITPINADDIELELNASIPTDIDLSTINEPSDLIRALLNSSISKDSLLSLLKAINDIARIKLIMNMNN